MTLFNGFYTICRELRFVGDRVKLDLTGVSRSRPDIAGATATAIAIASGWGGTTTTTWLSREEWVDGGPVLRHRAKRVVVSLVIGRKLKCRLEVFCKAIRETEQKGIKSFGRSHVTEKIRISVK
jgi:hypothetical protein